MIDDSPRRVRFIWGNMFGLSRQTAVTQGPFGPFQLHELINSGGMAEIWLATNARNEHLALRLMQETSGFDFLSKKRFLRGSEVLSTMSPHDSVIRYLGHGKINGILYQATEYVEGANLKQCMARNDENLAEFVGNIILDAASALEHVHDSGYMHLDFKPENIMVTANGGSRLIDFDLAQPIPDKPKKLTGNPGTPAYMAPEQLMRRPIDRRTDIFSFGVTAYEVLTFHKPFPGETPKEVLLKQIADRQNGFVPPRELNPAIPAGVEKAILKCIEADPERRYPYMSVLVRDLKSALYV
ncbi:MAG: serine/threonine protein kinase [Verrucomicrobia bacterium]|nr:serine/threonine protein kinase [Verrucomicrobiota bacterium]